MQLGEREKFLNRSLLSAAATDFRDPGSDSELRDSTRYVFSVAHSHENLTKDASTSSRLACGARPATACVARSATSLGSSVWPAGGCQPPRPLPCLLAQVLVADESSTTLQVWDDEQPGGASVQLQLQYLKPALDLELPLQVLLLQHRSRRSLGSFQLLGLRPLGLCPLRLHPLGTRPLLLLPQPCFLSLLLRLLLSLPLLFLCRVRTRVRDGPWR